LQGAGDPDAIPSLQGKRRHFKTFESRRAHADQLVPWIEERKGVIAGL
jgi:hypothetical protein